MSPFIIKILNLNYKGLQNDRAIHDEQKRSTKTRSDTKATKQTDKANESI